VTNIFCWRQQSFSVYSLTGLPDDNKGQLIGLGDLVAEKIIEGSAAITAPVAELNGAMAEFTCHVRQLDVDIKQALSEIVPQRNIERHGG